MLSIEDIDKLPLDKTKLPITIKRCIAYRGSIPMSIKESINGLVDYPFVLKII